MKHLLFIVCILASTLRIAGCMVGPRYQRPPVNSPDVFRAANAPEVNSQGGLGRVISVDDLKRENTRAGSLGDEKWAEVFKDPILQQLIREAVANNYDVNIVAQRVLEQQDRVGITRSQQFPTLSGGSSYYAAGLPSSLTKGLYSGGGAKTSSNLFSGGFSLSAAWNLDFWGFYRRQTEAARARLLATEWGRRMTISTVVEDVATAYLELRTLDSELEITRSTVEARKQSLQLTETLEQGGSASLADVRQAEELLYTATAEIPDFERQIQQEENSISTLLGRNPGPILRGATGVANWPLPTAQFPNIVPPEILVQATYPGADAKTLEQSVATPIEQQMSGVDNMDYMWSTNASNGQTQLNVDFDVKTDPNIDQVLSQLRVSQAQSQLPSEVNTAGITVQKSQHAPMMLIAVYSPKGTYDGTFLANYGYINLSDELTRVPGVARVQVFGAGQYAMRAWVKPDKLAKLGITVPEITQALQVENNVNPAGQIGGEPIPHGQEFTYTVLTQGRLTTADEFGEIILRANQDGSIVRLKDVARIELGAQTYNLIGRYNGRPATILALYQLPGSNAVETAKNVGVRMAQLALRFPQDMAYAVALDTTKAVTVGTAISGLRLLIGLTSLTAASLIPGFIFTIHTDRIRIPMLIVAVVGSLVNLYILWRIRSLRSRPSSQWRIQPPTAKQLRSERFQFVLSVLTLVLVVIESAIHHHLHGSL